jgi:hypothetical protein
VSVGACARAWREGSSSCVLRHKPSASRVRGPRLTRRLSRVASCWCVRRRAAGEFSTVPLPRHKARTGTRAAGASADFHASPPPPSLASRLTRRRTHTCRHFRTLSHTCTHASPPATLLRTHQHARASTHAAITHARARTRRLRTHHHARSGPRPVRFSAGCGTPGIPWSTNTSTDCPPHADWVDFRSRGRRCGASARSHAALGEAPGVDGALALLIQRRRVES